MSNVTIGTLMWKARKATGLTQKQLAAKIGVDRSAINRLEHHDVGSIHTIIKILKETGAPKESAREAISKRLGMTWPELAKVLGTRAGV